jgi:hypothetical protein
MTRRYKLRPVGRGGDNHGKQINVFRYVGKVFMGKEPDEIIAGKNNIQCDQSSVSKEEVR